MADHDGALLPAGEHPGDGIASVGIEVVGRLVEQDQVRFGDDEGGERGARALAAGEAGERPVRRESRQVDLSQRGFQPRFERPVRFRRVGERAATGLQSAQAGKRRAEPHEVGERVAFRRLHALAQQRDPAGTFDRAGNGGCLAGNHAEQRRLADAVAADQAGTVDTEDEIEIFEKRPAVRRCQRDGMQRDDGRGNGRHGERPGRWRKRGRRHASRSCSSVSPVGSMRRLVKWRRQSRNASDRCHSRSPRALDAVRAQRASGFRPAPE